MNFFRPKVSGNPSLYTVAVGAQKLEIPMIFFPVFESAHPRIFSLIRPDFLARIKMMNIKGARIMKSAMTALSAKRDNQFSFAFPYSALLVSSISALIPEVFLTSGATKSCFRRLIALFASAGMRPSIAKITGRTTIFRATFFDFVLLRLKRLFAVETIRNYGCFFHAQVLRSLSEKSSPEYCQIAKARLIQAIENREMDMFKDAPPEITQEVMM